MNSVTNRIYQFLFQIRAWRVQLRTGGSPGQGPLYGIEPVGRGSNSTCDVNSRYLEQFVLPDTEVVYGDVNLDELVNRLDIVPFAARISIGDCQIEANVAKVHC